jgi:hypothetical protein
MDVRLPCDRGGLRTWLLIVGLLAGRATPASIVFGLPLMLGAIALHLWSKGCLHQEKEVTACGPYRFVRHPFYVANLLVDSGIAVMSGWWLLLLAFPLWWLCVYVPVMRKEELIMRGIFGEAYSTYQACVPMLIPYRWPVRTGGGAGGFAWRNPNIRRVEIPRALRSLSYPLMFLIAYRVRLRGLGMIVLPRRFDILTVLACISLYIVSGLVKRHARRNRAGSLEIGTDAQETAMQGQ